MLLEEEITRVHRLVEAGESRELVQRHYDELGLGSGHVRRSLDGLSLSKVIRIARMLEAPDPVHRPPPIVHADAASTAQDRQTELRCRRWLGDLPLREWFAERLPDADRLFERALASASFSSESERAVVRELYESKKAEFVQSWAESVMMGQDALDREQALAVGDVGCHLQIVARAGSGKTRTLAARAAFLMSHCGVRPDEILMLAFNRRAAQAMSAQLAKWGGDPGVAVMTFHALAYSLVHPEEQLLFDGSESNDKARSGAVQGIIDDFLANPIHRNRIRSIMLTHFREDWERIEGGGYTLGRDEVLTARRALPRETLRGEFVKSRGEKLIANFLFEHGIQYQYERNHWWNGLNYRPDFTLPADKIVIEYFGRRGDADYDDQADRKREYWSEKEDWSLVELMPDSLDALHDRLAKHGVACVRLSEDEIWERVKGRAIDRFTTVCTNFIGRCRQRSLGVDDLRILVAAHPPIAEAEQLFLKLGVELYDAYLSRLSETGEEDFDGLLLRASDQVAAGRTVFRRRDAAGDLRKLRHVLIDEYQDFSELFDRLICAIRTQNQRVLVCCVGDDWQAINGFAGADLRFFRDFAARFENAHTRLLTTNYRSVETVVAAGNALMVGRGNSAVAHRPDKGGIGAVHLESFCPKTVEFELHRGDVITPALIRIIAKEARNGRDVVLLARTNQIPWYVNTRERRPGPLSLDEFLKHLRSFLPTDIRTRATISTTHKYKGLEKSAVIVMDAIDGHYPLIHPAWIFTRVFGSTPDSLAEEERRLFYVAITRAEDRLILITEGERRSPFVAEIDSQTRLPRVDWMTYPPLAEQYSDRLMVRVANIGGGAQRGTFDIKYDLKAAGYLWHSERKCWEKTVRSEAFDLEKLQREAWARRADGVSVKIFAASGGAAREWYSVRNGEWKEVAAESRGVFRSGGSLEKAE